MVAAADPASNQLIARATGETGLSFPPHPMTWPSPHTSLGRGTELHPVGRWAGTTAASWGIARPIETESLLVANLTTWLKKLVE